jgi:hypothetical protein
MMSAMKLIVVTPAGREKYLRLLSHHVLKSPEVSEWQLWDNCRNERDRAYLHVLAASDPRCKLKQLPGADGGWKIIGSFFRFCDDRDALYLRLDDDVIFLEDGFFPKFIERAKAERGKAIWFSPLVINNVICSFLIQHFSGVNLSGPISCQAMCPYAWAYPDLAEALHPAFVDAVKTGRIDAFRVPDHEIKLSRFSINALGFFGADKVALGDEFLPPGHEAEEEWLSAVLPARTGRPGKIFGDLLVAHFSFYPQERRLLQTDILAAYYQLAGVEVPVFEKPKPFIGGRVMELLRELRKPRRKPPQYTVSL